MYVPAPPAQPALALAPVEIVSTTPALAAPPLGRAAAARPCACAGRSLNVLDGRRVQRHRHAQPGARRAHGHAAGDGPPRLAAAIAAHAHRAPRGASASATCRAAPAASACACASPATRSTAPSHRRLGRLNVYRLAGASWYGGGGGLACGGSLTSSTLGVANKTLPCGTLVTLRYDGRSVRVPVVDRGPYVAGREFDLTEATKQALGFGDTGEVWSTR